MLLHGLMQQLLRVFLQERSLSSHCLVSGFQNNGARIHELSQSWKRLYLKRHYYMVNSAAKFCWYLEMHPSSLSPQLHWPLYAWPWGNTSLYGCLQVGSTLVAFYSGPLFYNKLSFSHLMDEVLSPGQLSYCPCSQLIFLNIAIEGKYEILSKSSHRGHTFPNSACNQNQFRLDWHIFPVFWMCSGTYLSRNWVLLIGHKGK